MSESKLCACGRAVKEGLTERTKLPYKTCERCNESKKKYQKNANVNKSFEKAIEKYVKTNGSNYKKYNYIIKKDGKVYDIVISYHEDDFEI